MRRRRRIVAAVPGRGGGYIMRESSPYSLASMDTGLEGWGSIVKSVKKAATQVAKVTTTAVKQAVVVQANLATAGMATRLTGMGKWSGTKQIGEISSKVSTGLTIAAAAVAGGVLLAGAVAPAAGAAGAGAVATEAAGGASILSMIGGGLKTAATLSPMALALLKAKQGAAATTAALVNPGEASGYPPGGFPGSGSWIGGALPGGGGGGGFAPDASGQPATDWLPLLLVGGIGVALIMQRR